MPRRTTRLHRFSSSLFLSIPLLLGACVDNSGGPPPPGDDLSLEGPSTELPRPFCESIDHEGALLADATDLEAWLEGCEDIGGGDTTAALRSALENEIAGLTEDRRLIGIRVVLGGCVQNWSLFGVRLDGSVLHPWVMFEDTSYGRRRVACTDDIGWDSRYVIVEDAAAAESVELWIGRYNPNLPGAPALPGGG